MATSLGLFWIVDILINAYRFPILSVRTSEPLGIYFKKTIIFSNVTLNGVIIILIYLSLTKNIWVLLGKLMASQGFCSYCVGVWSKYCLAVRIFAFIDDILGGERSFNNEVPY